jgi:hypothetical protein
MLNSKQHTGQLFKSKYSDKFQIPGVPAPKPPCYKTYCFFKIGRIAWGCECPVHSEMSIYNPAGAPGNSLIIRI